MFWSSLTTKKGREWLECSILFRLSHEYTEDVREGVTKETGKPSNSILNSSVIVSRAQMLLNLLASSGRTSMVVRWVARILRRRQNLRLTSLAFILFFVTVTTSMIIVLSPATWLPSINLWTIGFRVSLLLLATVGVCWIFFDFGGQKNCN